MMELIITAISQALVMAWSMLWEILWPLVLGFALSGMIQTVVSHQAMAKALESQGLHGGQPLLRDGLGIRLGRYRAGFADRWRTRCLGARIILASIFPVGQPHPGED